MQTAGGAVFKTKLFTLPRIWKQLQVSSLKLAVNSAAACLQSRKFDKRINQAGLHRVSSIVYPGNRLIDHSILRLFLTSRVISS